jgi:hypothetical protein
VRNTIVDTPAADHLPGDIFARGRLAAVAHSGLTGEGHPFPRRLAQEITREIERPGLLQQQIAAIAHEHDQSPTTCKDTKKKRALLLLTGGIGPTSSAVIAREVY